VGDEAIQPIENRKRLSLIDILNKAEIETHLVSNQTRSGSWNMAGPILFERATSAVYSVNERYAGNLEWRFPRPEESLFFKKNLEVLFERNHESAIFLHSYIGHYYYKVNLPDEFDQNVDNRFSNNDLANLFGDSLDYQSVLELVETSDSSY
jgi:glucan phosphoethanolaminetransferase (alkaline phosphatase superfamily)